LIAANLPFGDASPVFSWLSIVHWQNKGGLFGLMANHGAGRMVFLLIPLVIIAGLVYYLIAYRPSLLSRLSLTFVLAGAMGNMYDRISYGYVIDFIDVSLGSYHWPAFNVADSSITFGIGLWLLAQLLLPKEKATTGGKGTTVRAAR
jgi:signal peptidase II